MLTQEELKEILEYKFGNLYWKKSISQRIKVGDLAGPTQKIQVNGRTYATHRLVFLYHYGYIPECIEHLDGNKCNNAIENLQESSFERHFKLRSVRIEPDTQMLQ